MQAVPAQGLGCDPATFIQGVVNISDLQTSSGLLASSLSIIGAPNNSAVFLPTDAAWAAFRATNGATLRRACAGMPNCRTLDCFL